MTHFYLAANKTQGQRRTFANFGFFSPPPAVYEVRGLEGAARTHGAPRPLPPGRSSSLAASKLLREDGPSGLNDSGYTQARGNRPLRGHITGDGSLVVSVDGALFTGDAQARAVIIQLGGSFSIFAGFNPLSPRGFPSSLGISFLSFFLSIFFFFP